MMVCTHENYPGGQLGQVKSVHIKISFIGGVALFWSTDTHTHMQDRLDKPRSTLAEARLKTYRIPLVAITSVVGLHVDKHPYT